MTIDRLKLNRARIATMLIFLVCGIGLASWAPMVPYAKDRMALHEAHLGLLLLFLGCGALVTMPVAGMLINRLGTRIVIVAAALVIAIMLPLLLLVSSATVMAVVLFVFGAGVGSIDVAMNAHGVQVQNLHGRPIMSSLHGLFSVGGLFGALGLGFLVKLGLEPLHASLGIAILIIGIAFSQYRYFLDRRTERAAISAFTPISAHRAKRSQFPWLRGNVLFLGFMCFAVFLAEGAMLDWSAVFLRDVKGVSPEFSGIGFAAFSIAMASMRLMGDSLVERWSSNLVVLTGSMVAAAGLAIAVISPWIYLALLGYVLLGVGAANIVPIFFSDGGRLPGISPTVSIPAITTMGYAGQLVGPAALGFIAHHYTLSAALGLTAVLLAVVGIAYFNFSARLWQKNELATQPTINQDKADSTGKTSG